MTDEEVSHWHKERFKAVFKPDEGDVGRLVRVGTEGECHLWLKSNCGETGETCETYCTLDEFGELLVTKHSWAQVPDALFIPSRDVLAMYEGFLPLYESRELSFDETYRDLCMALQSPMQRGEAKSAALDLTASLRNLLGGDVKLRGGRFYVDFGDGDREAHLVAEGLRKIAVLTHLAGTGALRKGGILFWDEPEANLNPRLIAALAHILHRLAADGVQTFIATHDYLLSHKLSLAAEFATDPQIEMRFFSLHHQRRTDAVEVEAAATLVNINHNSILDEYALHYNEEQRLNSQVSDRTPVSDVP